MKVLNLGCGVRVSEKAINIDWSMYLRVQRSRVLSVVAPLFLSEQRKARLQALRGKQILVHDLSKGIPFETGTVDAVYHAHLLEHLNREQARLFLTECQRVLKPGGLIRIVVPDMKTLAQSYLESFKLAMERDSGAVDHEDRIADMIEQCVRDEAVGTTEQSGLRKWVDRFVMGDARKRGEIHKWMYDEVTLSHILRMCRFDSPKVQSCLTSQLPDWRSYGLDCGGAEVPFQPNSLYMEAVKVG
jgi:SAM-dependent methyltransferase